MKAIIPLTPNSGGVLKPKNIIGRDEQIITFWNILKHKGISLFAERRFGKSCIIRKMSKQPKPNFITIYKSVEGTNNPENFVDDLYEYAKKQKILSEGITEKIKEAWNTFSSHIPQASGIKFASSQTIWQKKLLFLISQILENNSSRILVIFLDEFSLMLDKMDSNDAALTLGTLRDIVHDYFPNRLRFVYTGSIGIELILNKIRNKGQNLGAPLNHLEKIKLLPFDQKQTIYFCQCLEEGCKISLDKSLRNHIYKISDGIPYFIDRIFDKIRYKSTVDVSILDDVLDELLNDSSDNSNMKHFYDRIRTYYPDKELSDHILNLLCKKNQWYTEKEIVENIQSLMDRDRTIINDELNRLWNDGYLIRDFKNNERHYSFQYRIIRMWWKVNKAYQV